MPSRDGKQKRPGPKDTGRCGIHVHTLPSGTVSLAIFRSPGHRTARAIGKAVVLTMIRLGATPLCAAQCFIPDY